VRLRHAVVLFALLGCRTGEKHAPPSPAGGVATNEDAGVARIFEGARSYPVRAWTFPLDAYEISIEDLNLSLDLGRVVERTGAEVVTNGGFFDRDGKALGLAVSGGARLAPLAPALSGGVVTFDGDRARLYATEGFTLPEKTRFAVQCRPRLVVDGAANVKSDDGKRAERTALCIRDEGRTLDLVVVRSDGASDEPGPSLFTFAQWLEKRRCEGALNLDGGPSTGVAWREERTRAPSVLPPRGPIRHALVFKKR
jgi:hypothetical protein